MGVFAGIRFLCRAGPMCPAAGYAFFGGAHGPRPTGCGGHTGRTESFAPTKQNKNRAKRDVVPQGHLFRCAPRQDAVPYGVHGQDGERWGKMFTLAALTLGNYYCIMN